MKDISRPPAFAEYLATALVQSDLNPHTNFDAQLPENTVVMLVGAKP